MSTCPHGIDTATRGCMRCTLILNPDPPDEVARDDVKRAAAPWAEVASGEAAPALLDIMSNALDRPPCDERVARERARCRAIVLKHFGSDWNGNQVLREIDET